MSHPIQVDQLRVVLVGARNPLNIGAAARAMSNFGFQHLGLVLPYELAFREARSARGGAELLSRAEEYSSVAEAVADCTLVVGTTAARDRELHHPLRSVSEGGRLIRNTLTTGRVALLFGSEKRGLLNDDLAHCHWLMRIPTRTESSSMNLGQAVAVCLYELIRTESRDLSSTPKRIATGAEIERISEILVKLLQQSGYTKPTSQELTMQKVRRMLRRIHLEVEDAELLLGMLRQIAWKMNSGGDKS